MATKSTHFSLAAPGAAMLVLVCLATTATASDPLLRILWSDQEGYLRDRLVSRGYDTDGERGFRDSRRGGRPFHLVPFDGGAGRRDRRHPDAGRRLELGASPRNSRSRAGTGRPFDLRLRFLPRRGAAARCPREGGRHETSTSWAKAIGRVAAHEIVHALTPQVPHSQGGLMMARLSREALCSDRLRMSSREARVFTGALTLRDRRR